MIYYNDERVINNNTISEYIYIGSGRRPRVKEFDYVSVRTVRNEKKYIYVRVYYYTFRVGIINIYILGTCAKP